MTRVLCDKVRPSALKWPPLRNRQAEKPPRWEPPRWETATLETATLGDRHAGDRYFKVADFILKGDFGLRYCYAQGLINWELKMENGWGK